MSVHGQLKIRSSAEQRAARERERAEKLRQYLSGCEEIFADRHQADPSTLFKRTESILVDHPDCFTLWNVRRETILRLDDDKQKEILQKELHVTHACLKSNPKSYSCWFQRQWILRLLKKNFQLDLYEQELQLCKKYLEFDERNFHCWAYRSYLLEQLSPSNLETFYETELTFLRSIIGANQSNYSAWHYRSQYLEKLLVENPSRRASLLSQEWQLVLSAVYTDCSDQAAWFYARWFLWKQLGSSSINDEEHLRPLEELNEIEPKNKWSMLILCQLWKEKNSHEEKRRAFLEQLATEIDPDRAQFYRDQL